MATFCFLRGMMVCADGVDGVDGAAAETARWPLAEAAAGRDDGTGGIATERTRRRCSERDRDAAKATANEFASFVVAPDRGGGMIMRGGGGRGAL